ncbi:MAG: hypothetical protein ACXWZ2_16130 [Mycobacterium sp.]
MELLMGQGAANRHHSGNFQVGREPTYQVRGDDRPKAVSDDDETP